MSLILTKLFSTESNTWSFSIVTNGKVNNKNHTEITRGKLQKEMRTLFSRAFSQQQYEDRDVFVCLFCLCPCHFLSHSYHEAHFLPCSIFPPLSLLPRTHRYCWSSLVWLDPAQAVSCLHARHGATARLKPTQLSRNTILMKQTILVSTKLSYAAEIIIAFILRWVVRD